MESQPQNSEFRINPENFHPCECLVQTKFCICIIIIIIIYLLFLKKCFQSNTGDFLIKVFYSLNMCFKKITFQLLLCFVFNVPPTAKVIWRRRHGLVLFDRLVKPRIKPATPGLQGKRFIQYTTAAPIRFQCKIV